PFFMDRVPVPGETAHEMQITLPMITCDNCTLQMLQYKYEVPPYDQGFYFQCADIVIAGDPVGGTSTTTTMVGSSTTTGSGGGTSGATTGGGAGPAGSAPARDSGGCSIVAHAAQPRGGSAWFALPLLAVFRRRRRSA